MGRSQVALVTGKVEENSPFLPLPMNLERLGRAAQGSFRAEHPYCEHTELFSVLALAMSVSEPAMGVHSHDPMIA